MIRSYLRSAIRSLRRDRGISALNIAGLSVGLASCFLIVAFIQHELSYDVQHPDVDRMYRLINEDSLGTMLNRSAIVLGRGTAAIPDLVPSVDNITRLHRRATWLIHEDRMVREGSFVWSDPDVFETFDFPLAVGDPSTALVNPNTVVISRPLARSLFGDDDPMGKTVEAEGTGDLTVTGILAEPTGPSHVTYEAFASMATLASIETPWDAKLQGWTYVTLKPGTNPDDVEQLLNEHAADLVPMVTMDGMKRAFRLQPVLDIRLYSADVSGAGQVSDVRRVRLFSLVVVLILLLACANFANLSTVQSLRRAKEVGVRKTVGAGRGQLMAQFLSESVAVSFMAFALALGLVALVHPWFAQRLAVELTMADFLSFGAMGWFLAIAIGTGLLAGIYPAAYLSRFQAALVVKGGTPSGRAGRVRNVLVTGQFAIAAALIFASTAVVGQMRFLADRDLGYDSDNVVMVNTAGLDTSVETLMDAIRNVPGVEAGTYASGSPVNGGFVSEGELNGQKVPVHRILADEAYPDALGLRLVAGRFWDPERPGEGDRTAIVNQAYVDAQGWTEPLSEYVPVGRDDDGNIIRNPVIGVLENFNIGSARNPVEPLILDASKSMSFFRRQIVVRIHPASQGQAMAGIEQAWKNIMPNRPFNASYLNDRLADLHADDDRMSSLLSAFTLLALLVSNLGMIGLAALAIALRRKEIGVRKVLGAGQTALVTRLSRDFMLLVGLAFALAIPVAWFGIERWLQEFAFRIELGPGHVITALLLVALPSLLVVLSQALRSARMDPVKCLRTE